MLDNPLSEEFFPNIQSKPVLVQLEVISPCPIACYLGEETECLGHAFSDHLALYIIMFNLYILDRKTSLGQLSCLLQHLARVLRGRKLDWL